MSIFQLAAIFFALFMMYVVTIHNKKKHIGTTEYSFWCTTWVMFIIIALFPDLLLGITGVLKFARVFDLLIVVALMILTTVVLTSYMTHKENTKKLEQLVRKFAIEKRDEKK